MAFEQKPDHERVGPHLIGMMFVPVRGAERMNDARLVLRLLGREHRRRARAVLRGAMPRGHWRLTP